MLTSNFYALSGLVISLTFFPLFFFTFSKGKTNIARYFSYHLFAVAIWGIVTLLVGVNSGDPQVYHLWNLSFSLALFIPVFLLHSVLLMTERSSPAILILIYAQAILFALLTFFGRTFPTTKYMFNSMYYNQGGSLYLAAVIIWLGIVSLAHLLLLKHYWTAYPEKKKNALMLLLAIPIGFGGGVMNFLPAFGIDIFPFGNFLIPFYSMIVAYAIFQYQFLEIQYVLRKGLTYIIVISLIALTYSLTIILFEPLLKELIGHETMLPGILATFILGIVFAPLRLKVEYLVDRTFFKKTHKEIVRQNELLQQELMRSEKFKMVSNIARGIVYEIRNPLTTIKALSRHIEERLDDKEFLIKSSQTIDRQVERVNALLHKLLNFSTPSTPDLKQASIYNVFDDVLNILGREFLERNVRLIKNFEKNEAKVLQIDPVQFRQALYNIILNALEAMPEGGTLTLTTRIKPFSDIVQKNFDPKVNNFFEIKIFDTGRGIPQESLPLIFDPFYSLEEKKIGLGLTIAHKIIKDHGGNIIVESEVNKGSTFTIELPLMR